MIEQHERHLLGYPAQNHEECLLEGHVLTVQYSCSSLSTGKLGHIWPHEDTNEISVHV